MTFAINVPRAWRFRDRKRGARVLSPGVYYVPEQLEERYALLAIDQGMAVRMSPPATLPKTLPPMPMPVAPVDPVELTIEPPAPIEPSPTASKPRRRRGRRRKGPAPENKLFDVAAN